MSGNLSRRSNKGKILHDLRLLSDEPDPKSDLFNFNQYARQIKNVIFELDPDISYSIMIHGEWGSGKSSLIEKTKNMVKSDLKENWKVIYFEAWKYEKLDPAAALMALIAEEYKNKSTKFKKSIKGISLFLSDVALRSTAGMSVNEFLNHFNDSMEKIPEIKIELKEMIGNGRLIVFVDDLDRCMVDNVLKILESLKLFLQVEGAIFVVVVDKEKIERAWTLRYLNSITGPIEGKDHIDKIFQLKLSLPPKPNSEIEKYVKRLANSLPEQEVKLLVKGCPHNPRKIKRILNEIFFLSSSISQENFKDKFPYVVVWSILANDYPELAQITARQPRSFVQMIIMIFWLGGYDFFKATIPKIEQNKKDQKDSRFRSFVLTPSNIRQSTIEGLKVIAQNRRLYIFMRSLMEYFRIEINELDPIDEQLKIWYEKLAPNFSQTINNSGLVSAE